MMKGENTMKNQKIESLLDVVNNARTLLDAAFIFHKTYEKCLDAKLTYGDMSVVINTLFEKEDVTLFDDAIRIDSLLSGADTTIMNINDNTIMSLTAINNVCCDILMHNERGYVYEKCPDGTFGYKNLLNVTSKFVEIIHRQKEQLDQVHDENEKLRAQVNELLQRLDDMQQKATVKNSGKKSKKKLEQEAEVIIDQNVITKAIDNVFKLDPSTEPEVPTTANKQDDVQDTQEDLSVDPIVNDEENEITPDEQTNIDLRRHIIGALDATKRNVQNAYNKLKNDGVEVSMYQIFNVKYGTNPKDADKEDVYAVIRYARGLEVSDIMETIKTECNYTILPRDIVRATRKANK
jgi:hypothetical protein